MLVAYVEFVDGIRREVFEEPDGRQYVLDGDDQPIYGIWFIPREECDPPLIVDAGD
jgi:hypothetical protein